jgi:hypothetical protein
MSHVAMTIVNRSESQIGQEGSLDFITFSKIISEVEFEIENFEQRLKDLVKQQKVDFQASLLGMLQLLMTDQDWHFFGEELKKYLNQSSSVPQELKEKNLTSEKLNFLMMCQILGVPLWKVFENSSWQKTAK